MIEHSRGCASRTVFVLTVALLWVAGCATVPRESVDLSVELTGMIVSARDAHLALLDQYMAERKVRVNEFLQNTWTPQFMENAFRDTAILDSLNAVSSEEEKMMLLNEFLQDAEVQIVRRRSSLLNALVDIGGLLEEEVQQHFDDMLTVNQALTAHLESAADVTESRNHLAETLKIDTKSLLPMAKIDSLIDEVSRFQGKAEDVAGYVDRVRSLLKGK